MKLLCIPLAAATLLVAASPALAEAFPPAGPEFLTIDENNLLLGKPSTPVLAAATQAQAAALLAAVAQEKIEARYVVGSCEDRAHLIALIARKAGLSVGKVWAIAPARYTLLSRELFAVTDPNGVVESVTWGHHVAPVLRVTQPDGEIRTVVLDLAFDRTGYLSLDDWTRRLGSPRGKFFFTGVDDYLFNSLNGLTVYDNRTAYNPPSQVMPNWMPNILTGDFMTYSPGYHDPIIAGGLAQDELAMRVFDTLASFPSGERAALRAAIRQEMTLTTLTGTGPIDGIGPATLTGLRAFYAGRRQYWLSRLAALH